MLLYKTLPLSVIRAHPNPYSLIPSIQAASPRTAAEQFSAVEHGGDASVAVVFCYAAGDDRAAGIAVLLIVFFIAAANSSICS